MGPAAPRTTTASLVPFQLPWSLHVRNVAQYISLEVVGWVPDVSWEAVVPSVPLWCLSSYGIQAPSSCTMAHHLQALAEPHRKYMLVSNRVDMLRTWAVHRSRADTPAAEQPGRVEASACLAPWCSARQTFPKTRGGGNHNIARCGHLFSNGQFVTEGDTCFADA